MMPSTDEAFGVAYIEAMAAGVPAIGCRGEPGPEEIAAAGDGFVLVPPGDIERLTQRIDELLVRPPAAARGGPARARDRGGELHLGALRRADGRRLPAGARVKPVLFVTGNVPAYRVGALRALHEREGIEVALFGGRSVHGGPASDRALPFPAARPLRPSSRDWRAAAPTAPSCARPAGGRAARGVGRRARGHGR